MNEYQFCAECEDYNTIRCSKYYGYPKACLKLDSFRRKQREKVGGTQE